MLWQEWLHYISFSVSSKTMERAWRLLTQKDSGLLGLLARTESGQAVGLAHLSITPYVVVAAPVVYLQELIVTAAMRKLGVGAALMKSIYDLADEIGAAQVFWVADENDAALQRFYLRHSIRTPYVRFLRHPWAGSPAGSH